MVGEEWKNSLLNLLPNFHSPIIDGGALVATKTSLLRPHGAGPLHEGRDGDQVEVAGEVVEEGAADADEGAVGGLGAARGYGGERGVVDDDLVEAGLDQAAGDVLQLLAGLHEQVVARRDLDGDPPARVARPDVQARIPAAAVDGEEVEVRVEPGQDGVLLAVLAQV